MYRYLQHVKLAYPMIDELSQIKIAKSNYDKNIKVIKSPKLLAKRMNDIIDSDYGIFSMSETNNNLLMWAHYSDSHQGFCIEFAAEKLAHICNNYIFIKELILVKKVKYEFTYPFIDPYKLAINTTDFIDWIVTKSKEWEYEKEWRLVYVDHPDEVIIFPEEIFTGIYFGVNAKEKTIDTVIGLFNNKKVVPKFYRGELKYREFGIVFKQIKV